jgi:hypothetical protein
LATAPAADERIGTAAISVQLVIPQTRHPKKTFVMQMVHRTDQLNSKKTGVVAIVDEWMTGELGSREAT